MTRPVGIEKDAFSHDAISHSSISASTSSCWEPPCCKIQSTPPVVADAAEVAAAEASAAAEAAEVNAPVRVFAIFDDEGKDSSSMPADLCRILRSVPYCAFAFII